MAQEPVGTQEPLVTIIIPIYNGAKYMREAIDSALGQTYQNIEIVVVNDGSTDNTHEIAQTYGNKIRYFSKENGGVATALNRAIQESRGEYISWLSHDDVYYPHKIHVQVDLLRDKLTIGKDVIVWSDYTLIDKDSDDISTTHFEKTHDAAKLRIPTYPLLKGLIHGCTLLIPRKLFQEVGMFNVDLKTTQDYDLWYRMFPQCEIFHMSDVLVKSRWHDEQGSKTIENVSKEADDLWINMIESVEDAERVHMDGSQNLFLKNAQKVVSDAEYVGAQEYIALQLDNRSARDISLIKVSVIIPFCDRLDWVFDAVKSVLDQTHSIIEIILVNDTSTESLDVLQELISTHDNVILVDNERSPGASGARNIGIDVASGEYVAFLDSDDLFVPEKIEKQLQFMVSNNEVFTHTSYEYFGDDSLQSPANVVQCPDFEYPYIIGGCSIATPTVMVELDFLRSVERLFPEDFFGGEDIALWIDLCQKSMCKGIPEKLSRVRLHGENHAYSAPKQIKGMSNILRYVATNHYSDETLPYIRQLTQKYESCLSSELIAIENSNLNRTSHNHLESSVDSQEVRNSWNTFFSKSFVREQLKNILWTFSPFFRMQLGNKKRLISLSDSLNQLQSALGENAGSSERNVEDHIGDIKGAVYDLVAKQSLKDRFVKRGQQLTVNGDVPFYPLERKSETKEFKCDVFDFFEHMKDYIIETDVVLDIGVGIRPQIFFEPSVHLCVEPFKQYRDVVKPFFPNRSHFVFMREGALESMRTLDDQSVDTVIMIDLIEHLEKEDGLELLKEADRIARTQIIVFTPLGFYPMHFQNEGDTDAWGLDGNDLQEHRSGWLPEDFDATWDFYICVDCHDAFLPEEKALGKKYSGLMAIKTKKFVGFPQNIETPQFVREIYKGRVVSK